MAKFLPGDLIMQRASGIPWHPDWNHSLILSQETDSEYGFDIYKVLLKGTIRLEMSCVDIDEHFKKVKEEAK